MEVVGNNKILDYYEAYLLTIAAKYIDFFVFFLSQRTLLLRLGEAILFNQM